MLSKIPIDLTTIAHSEIDKEVLRSAIIAELDAINLYEQMSESATSADIKNLLLDIAKEEKVHYGEFQAILLELDKEQVDGIEQGQKEVNNLTK